MGFLYSQLFVTPTYPSKSFEGQTVIVTGSNVGLGREAARHIARLGAAKVIIAVRNLEAGEEARQDIISTTKCSPDVVEVWKLDLSDYASVKAFAKRADKELERIDVLLENAGIATDKFNLAEGHERTITVNVISTFLLALMLVPKLKKTATDFNVKPHLVIVSSEVHAWSKFPEWKNEQGIFKALDVNDPKSMAERYQTSKLLEVLVIRHIAPKLEGSGVIMNFVNPGLCHSELARDSGWTLYIMKLLLARTTEVGSRNLVIAASIGSDSHGKYISDTKIDQGSLSSFVTSKDGETAAFRVWKELKDILENIQKGVTSGF